MPYPTWWSTCIFTLLPPYDPYELGIQSPTCFLRAQTKQPQNMPCMAVNPVAFYSSSQGQNPGQMCGLDKKQSSLSACPQG